MHIHTHSREWALGSAAGSVKRICVWRSQRFLGLSPPEPLCLIQGQQVHRGTKRVEKGGKVRADSFFFTLSPQLFFLFLTSKATLQHLNGRHDSLSGNLEKAWSFLSHILSFARHDEKIKRRCRLRCNTREIPATNLMEQCDKVCAE